MKPLKSGRAKTYCRPLASKSGGAFALPALQLVLAFVRVQNRIQVQMHPWMLVETTRVTEFEYNTTSLVHVRAFTYRRRKIY